MIFSSVKFIFFWLITLFSTKKFSLNTSLFFGIVGLVFYSFQGYINFAALLFVFLTSFFYLKLKKFLYLFIGLTLLPLFLFKYSKILIFFDFNNYLISLFQNNPVPPGLSFTTFSAIALILAIKQGILENLNYKKLLGYLFFFPQLIAGPIVMPKFLIPQLENFPKISFDKFKLGIFIFSIGIFIKIILADSIAQYIDPILSNIKVNSLSDIIVSIILFSQQIYFDFNGYTLMALGISISFGINLPENFNAPYLATSISEFWKRWHITLSNWIKDFIYIPLGGSKCSNARHFINIFLAMIASGIWHGYGLTFIFWGLFHGLAIVLEKIFKLNISNKHLKIFLTYLIVTILWSLFRINSFEDWKLILNKDIGLYIFNFEVLSIFLFCFLINYLQTFLTLNKINKIYQSVNKQIGLVISVIIIVFCCLISEGSSQKFIYFNF